MGREILGLPASDDHRATATPDGPGVADRPDIDEAVASLERTQLLAALEAARGNVTRAARHLGLTRNTFRYRLRKHHIGSDGPALLAVGDAPPARPPAASAWERRRVVFIRVALVAPDDRAADHRAAALLEQARGKVALFGGSLDGVSPRALTAVFGLDLGEDAARRAAHAAMAIRKLGGRAREADATLPAMSLAIHAVRVLLWKTAASPQVDAEARPLAWQALDRLVVGAGEASIAVSEEAAAALRGTFILADRLERADGTCLLLDGEAPSRLAGVVFVGRRDDMAMLQGRLDMARAGRGQVVGIAGEPGIGKSRMLFEFRRTLSPDNITYISAHSPSYGRDLALLPIVELVRRAHGVGDGDDPVVARDKLRSGLAALGLGDDLTPFLLRLAGIDEGGEALAHLGPETLHQRTVEAFRDLALAASRARPLVIAVEDLHWMDRASERYLAALIDALVDAPILLVTTFRGGYRPPWSERSYVFELKLQPLARDDARRVLESAAERDGRAALRTEVAEAILDRADGNPFFIEELTRAVGSGPAAGAVSMSESVEAVLLARIDRLPDDTKRVLQTSAVLGRDVPVRLLEAVTPEASATGEHLRELQRLEYLHGRGGEAGGAYRFKHALTQEVAYASLLPEDRRVLHAGVAAAIEAQHADRLADHAEQLARHALRGELWQKAAGYLRQVGRKARARGASHEAVTSFEQALAALDHLPGGSRSAAALDLRLDLHRPLMALSSYHRALDHLAEAATLAKSLGDRPRLGQVRAGQCLILRATGSNDEAIQAGQEARVIAAELGDAHLAVDMSYLLGSALHMKGELAAAEACYRECFGPLDGELTRERALSLPRYAAGGRAFFAWLLETVGKFDEALLRAREAVAIADLRGERVSQIASHCMLGKVQSERGDQAGAIPGLEETLAVCRLHDVRTWLSPVTTTLALAYMHAGRLGEAIALFEEGVAHAGATGQMTNYPARIARLAQAYLRAGRRAEAAATVRRGTELARKHGQRPDEAECLRVTGLIAAADPAEVVEAEGYSRQALALADSLGMRPLAAHCHLDLGRLLRKEAQDEAAREHFASAMAIYEALGMTGWLEEAGDLGSPPGLGAQDGAA